MLRAESCSTSCLQRALFQIGIVALPRRGTKKICGVGVGQGVGERQSVAYLLELTEKAHLEIGEGERQRR